MKFISKIDIAALSFIILVAVTLLVSISFEEEPIVEEEPIAVKTVDMKQLACLAENIFYEAGSESLSGQAAVARVVINRVNHGFAPTPCKVIHQSYSVVKTNEETDKVYSVRMCQFSWVCEGKKSPNKNSEKYQQAERVAYDVLAYDAYSEIIPKTALFFHNLSVNPLWPYQQVAKIGNHVFYSKAKKKQKHPTKVLNDEA